LKKEDLQADNTLLFHRCPELTLEERKSYRRGLVGYQSLVIELKDMVVTPYRNMPQYPLKALLASATSNTEDDYHVGAAGGTTRVLPQ
jgi:hypothetical protein